MKIKYFRKDRVKLVLSKAFDNVIVQFFSLELCQKLIEWYRKNGRKLPWREIKDPYKIWISEVILQQTRVNQGWQYYLRFIEAFPNVYALAQANINQVLQVWQGLGYYSRAIHLHATAQQLVKNYGGKLPADPRELLQLKGIGSYTANAIASFAYQAPVVVLDGNVLRIVSRFYADSTPIECKNYYQEKVNTWLQGQNSAEFNNALMDLGALICTPQKPSCHLCPLQSACLAFIQKQQGLFPYKSKTLKRRIKYYHFFLVQNSNSQILLIQKDKKSFWKLLWVLPYNEVQEEAFLKLEELPLVFQGKHTFTHFDMHFAIYKYQNDSSVYYKLEGEQVLWLSYSELSKAALPAALKKAIVQIFEQPILF
ncbi:MAG: A/G-specific adenine glycosylase [Bacteroidia bacterium]|nr:A/G-specific adenine glycosylase [Bacteroidia bacterium]MDW8158101.1 A/G-specific adenine glycosylase [Bacteroidia bacterium]